MNGGKDAATVWKNFWPLYLGQLNKPLEIPGKERQTLDFKIVEQLRAYMLKVLADAKPPPSPIQVGWANDSLYAAVVLAVDAALKNPEKIDPGAAKEAFAKKINGDNKAVSGNKNGWWKFDEDKFKEFQEKQAGKE